MRDPGNEVGCMPIGLQRRIDSPTEPLALVSCVFGGMYRFYFLFRSVGFGAWTFGGLGPSSTLFTGPSFSKHLGGKGMVVAAHSIVMDTLPVWLGVIRGPNFLISGLNLYIIVCFLEPPIPKKFLLWGSMDFLLELNSEFNISVQDYWPWFSALPNPPNIL